MTPDQPSLRERIDAALKAAMRDRDAGRTAVLRMAAAAIKDRDIAARSEGQPSPVGDDGVTAVLVRMVKQRGDSARAFEEAGRPDLAAREQAEAAILEEFLPRALSESEAQAAVEAAIRDSGASGLRDMGRVMALLRERHAGALDMGRAGGLVKARLGGG
ncbi:GatB/YqeY domain-containing protein [Rubellimicrobium sp. CFH 75288]|uniref:GatB/YqeY domain-containing protein n=1 Tax=Rubellimicrobium sp. CFH 75288 TaxID=2697034 RepID=UPI001411F6FF|nr:GatB/YqeY domain-containing protein [Rubellimicrobium sp. CFH 75288]NAZ35773.1 GatB/YqeY domain-containing protein [Rubellimicrobium sp. CFH 75288]